MYLHHAWGWHGLCGVQLREIGRGSLDYQVILGLQGFLAGKGLQITCPFLNEPQASEAIREYSQLVGKINPLQI